MGLLSSGLSTWSMVGQSSLAKAAEAASPFCLESLFFKKAKTREIFMEKTDSIVCECFFLLFH